MENTDQLPFMRSQDITQIKEEFTLAINEYSKGFVELLEARGAEREIIRKTFGESSTRLKQVAISLSDRCYTLMTSNPPIVDDECRKIMMDIDELIDYIDIWLTSYDASQINSTVELI